MKINLSTQIDQELEEWERLKRLQREKERREREEKKKEEKHWCFVAGELVAKYLKKDLGIEVYKGKGATAKNAVSFAPLENILLYLAANKEFTAQIKEGKGVLCSDSSVIKGAFTHRRCGAEGGDTNGDFWS